MIKFKKYIGYSVATIFALSFILIGVQNVGAYIYNPTGSTITSPVSPANGGTGTSTVFTQGSVVFAGASGIYSQDNANFFWDSTNHRLGIGETNPATKLDIAGGGVLLDATQSVYGNALTGNRGQIEFYNGSNGSMTFSSTFLTADQIFNVGNNVNSNGMEAMRIAHGGNVGIGTTTPTSSLMVDNGAAAQSIFVARDNGTPVFTIADGGNVTASGTGQFANVVVGTNNNKIVVGDATLDFGAAATDSVFTPHSGKSLQLVGGLSLTTAGLGISVKSGSNALAGTFTMVAGSATVTSTAIDANTVVIVSLKTLEGTSGIYTPLTTVTSGSFTATSVATDTSTYNWVALKVN